MSKKCSRCKEIKPFDGFSKDRQHSSGYKSACKPCSNKDYNKWRVENLLEIREKDKVSQVMKKYKISKEEAEYYCNNRIGLCEICNTESFRVIDHCHSSGKIRGFICSPCNSMLGYSRDSTDTLHSAIEYLRNRT